MKKLIVVGTQRTGSSAVAESIGLHPLVSCGWEWTLGVPIRKKLTVAERGLNLDFRALNPADQTHLAGIYRGYKEWIGFRWLFSSSDKWAVNPPFRAGTLARRAGKVYRLGAAPAGHPHHSRRASEQSGLAEIHLPG